MRDGQTTTNDKQVKIELLSQWMLEAEFRKIEKFATPVVLVTATWIQEMLAHLKIKTDKVSTIKKYETYEIYEIWKIRNLKDMKNMKFINVKNMKYEKKEIWKIWKYEK